MALSKEEFLEVVREHFSPESTDDEITDFLASCPRNVMPAGIVLLVYMLIRTNPKLTPFDCLMKVMNNIWETCNVQV